MKQGDDDLHVTIDIRIPTGGKPRITGTPRTQDLLEVTFPTPNGVAKVLANPGDPSGKICARGSGAIQGGTPASHVYAMVYQGYLTNNQIPLNPPPCIDNVTPFGNKGSWEFAEVAGAACDAAGKAANTLVIWVDFGGPGYEIQVIYFTGKQSDTTDCGAGVN